MSTKTISVRLEAYERLKEARQSPRESFSQVILRAKWPKKSMKARDLLEMIRQRGYLFPDANLDAIEDAKKLDNPPEDKWQDS